MDIMPCYFTNLCTLYQISIEALSFKKSVPKILSWEIGKLSKTTSILNGCPMNETWIEPNDSTKPSVTSTICNLAFLRICMFGCKLLAFIRLSSAPVSNMKTNSRNNPYDGYDSDGECWKLFRVYYCDSAFSSSGSIFWVSIILSLYIHRMYPVRTCSRFVRWPRRVSRASRICDIPQFCALYYYNNDTIWSSVHFLSLHVHNSYCLNRNGFIIKLFARILPAAIVSLISPFASLKVVSDDTILVARKSVWRSICLLWFVFSQAPDSPFQLIISMDERSFRFSISIQMSLGNRQ